MYDYKLIDWEERLIERNEFWLDCVMHKDKPKRSWNDSDDGLKCLYYENKNLVMEFLQSNKRTKSFDYDTTREASRQAYRFESVINRYHLNAKVSQNGNRVTITRTRLRG